MTAICAALTALAAVGGRSLLHVGPPSTPVPVGLTLVAAVLVLGAVIAGGTVALDRALARIETRG